MASTKRTTKSDKKTEKAEGETKSVSAEKTEKPKKAAKTTKAAKPAKPAKAAKPAKPAKPAKAAKAETPAKPVQAEKPAKAKKQAKPIKSKKASQAATSTKADKAEKPAAPAKASEPATPELREPTPAVAPAETESPSLPRQEPPAVHENVSGADIAQALRVTEGFLLAEAKTDATPGFSGDRQRGEALLRETAQELGELQERLYAESRGGGTRSLLLIVQGMDTSGKGGIMRHVIGLMDPQGVRITAFKAPTAEEAAHPFLWRIRQALPEPGMIGVFDRSHYEDVLIARVRQTVPKATWARRYSQINAFEKSTVDRGTRVVKVMLHLGAQEQKARLGERLARSDKHWKFRPGDIDERLLWADYQEAYQAVLDRTSTDYAPWYVVPADHKWYARLAVHHILLEELRAMEPQWPAAAFDVAEQQRRLEQS